MSARTIYIFLSRLTSMRRHYIIIWAMAFTILFITTSMGMALRTGSELLFISALPLLPIYSRHASHVPIFRIAIESFKRFSYIYIANSRYVVFDGDTLHIVVIWYRHITDAFGFRQFYLLRQILISLLDIQSRSRASAAHHGTCLRPDFHLAELLSKVIMPMQIVALPIFPFLSLCLLRRPWGSQVRITYHLPFILIYAKFLYRWLSLLKLIYQ